jgi:hypothetical protein
LVENHRGDAGRKPRVAGMADADARYIGEEIFQVAAASASPSKRREAQGLPETKSVTIPSD